ncbi:uncharacterized protein F4807DRAFT_434056 [Annulohypoxylon truncatum]|uniref:uncharacterized protein n=1 Tax=Annulohypoxylon truncatum TaxID=327061 RepID=UPI0020079CC8|nr:uncharacterized protein F4807DRAFT_434056 [Annulohypoxylon truncatum]KAI1207657.1 hypothetical protein F4807DRAFT_434056 [Annulohypoxylon truncatum]
MRLFCELDGERLDIHSALKQDPYEVRGLLIDALLLCSQEALPDTVDVILAEQALRTALDEFPGGQEKYVRSYILYRKLDHRTQISPRAPLIALSLQAGGVFALIAVVYATLDVHRNLRNRETLERLVNGDISEQSKRDLFKRANGFSVHHSFAAWFNRLLDHLDRDSIGVACLLYCFGTPMVPRVIFSQCRKTSKTWNRDGEVSETTITITETIRDPSRFGAILQKLEMLGFVKSTVDMIRVNRRLADILKDREETLAWKVRAVQLLLHALPKDRKLEPDNYDQYYETMLPNLSHVMSYFVEPQILTYLVKGPGPGLYDAVEVCLASSHFNDLRWKENAITTATGLVRACEENNMDPSDIALLKARLHVRTLRLSLSQSAALPSEEIGSVTFPSPADARINAFSADLVMLKARASIRYNNLALAQKELSCFRSLFLSTFEHAQEESVKITRAIVYRFQGQFPDAYEILSSVRMTGSEVLVHLGATACEMGEPDKAVTRLEGWLMLSKLPTSKAGVRIRVALANAYLMKGLREVLSGQAWSNRQEVQTMYRELEPNNHLIWVDRIAVSIGMAITEHWSGQYEPAIRNWQGVRDLTRKLELPLGYTDVIVDFSICELNFRFGRAGLSDVIKARESLASIGRQYYFTALGSIWPDLLEKLAGTI